MNFRKLDKDKLKASRKRHVAKTISWRITATTTTFLLVWIFTGDVGIGLTVGGFEAIAKMFLYYLHERAWYRIDIGS